MSRTAVLDLTPCLRLAASAVLVTASTEVDKSGGSYYGEQTLHYLAVNGETAVIQLRKNRVRSVLYPEPESGPGVLTHVSLPHTAKRGPIYDVAWSPNSSEFCVVYGFMPAKATIFNLKCDPVFDFGTGPRNAAYYRSDRPRGSETRICLQDQIWSKVLP